MPLSYRPKFLPRDRESGPQRVRRRLGLATRTAFAPEPFIAPAGLYAGAEDPRRAYIPGPVLCAQHGLILFRDGPPATWPNGREPIEPSGPVIPAKAGTPPAWTLWLQSALLIGAVIAGGIVGVGLPQ